MVMGSDEGSPEDLTQGDLDLGEQNGVINSSNPAEPVASSFAVALREKVMVARKESTSDILVRDRKGFSRFTRVLTLASSVLFFLCFHKTRVGRSSYHSCLQPLTQDHHTGITSETYCRISFLPLDRRLPRVNTTEHFVPRLQRRHPVPARCIAGRMVLWGKLKDLRLTAACQQAKLRSLGPPCTTTQRRALSTSRRPASSARTNTQSSSASPVTSHTADHVGAHCTGAFRAELGI